MPADRIGTPGNEPLHPTPAPGSREVFCQRCKTAFNVRENALTAECPHCFWTMQIATPTFTRGGS